MTTQGPFDRPMRNDVDVRKSQGYWVIGCANCWGAFRATDWPTAIHIANDHAKDCR